jgi:hypothetical protein
VDAHLMVRGDQPGYKDWVATWTNPSLTLNPGEGCVIPVPQAWRVTFTGDVPQGRPVNALPMPMLLSIRTSSVPQRGAVDVDLGFPSTSLDSHERVTPNGSRGRI